MHNDDDVRCVGLANQDLQDLIVRNSIHYSALNDLQDQIAEQSSNIITYRLPSYGTFSTKLTPQYWYGLPRKVSSGVLTMDIDRIKLHRTNNNDEVLAFNHASGARMSAMEHLVPEQMFSTETDKAQGVSAVKALAIAGQQGQKIWTIDKNNIGLALSNISLSTDAESDIRNAVNTGRIAIAHESRINFNGWIGEGYILRGSKTGAGAYMISGGRNRGEVVSDILGAGFDLAVLLFGYEQHQNHGSVSAVYRFLGAIFNTVGVVFAAIFTVFDISERCKSIGFSVSVFLIALHVAIILAFTFFAFFTGGLAMFLLNTVINMVLKQVMLAAMSIVERDVGCDD